MESTTNAQGTMGWEILSEDSVMLNPKLQLHEEVDEAFFESHHRKVVAVSQFTSQHDWCMVTSRICYFYLG